MGCPIARGPNVQERTGWPSTGRGVPERTSISYPTLPTMPLTHQVHDGVKEALVELHGPDQARALGGAPAAGAVGPAAAAAGRALRRAALLVGRACRAAASAAPHHAGPARMDDPLQWSALSTGLQHLYGLRCSAAARAARPALALPPPRTSSAPLARALDAKTGQRRPWWAPSGERLRPLREPLVASSVSQPSPPPLVPTPSAGLCRSGARVRLTCRLGGLTKKLPPAPVPDSAAPTAHKWPTPPSLAQRNHIDGFSKQGCAKGPSPVHHSSPAARGLPGCRIWWPPRRAAASRAQSGPPASRAASRAAAWRAAGPRTRLPLRGRPRVPRRCSRTRRSGSVLRRQRLAAPACPAHSRALCGDIRTRRAPTQRAAPAFRCGGSSLQAVTLACRRTKEARPRLAARRAAERQAAIPPRQAGVSPPSGRLAAW